MSSCHVLCPSLDYQFILALHQLFTKVKNYHAGIADNNRHRRSERRSVGGGGRLLDGRSHLSRASPFQTISPYSQNDNQEVIIFVVVKPDFFFFSQIDADTGNNIYFQLHPRYLEHYIFDKSQEYRYLQYIFRESSHYICYGYQGHRSKSSNRHNSNPGIRPNY